MVKNKTKSIVILPDVHMAEECPVDYEIVKKFIKDFRPDEVIILGDFMDVNALSAWDMGKRGNMENRRYKKEIARAEIELDYLQEHSKKVTFIEGNHEYRVPRYIELHPELEGLIEIPQLLNLEERGIDWIPFNELECKRGHMYFTHGMWISKYFANKHIAELGCNVCIGHTHKTQTAFQNQSMARPIMCYGLGTLGDKAPDYMQGRPSNWINQFGIFYYEEDTGNFNLYPVNIIENKFIWNGKIYK